MANFVLVPAAWTGGWVWDKVAPILRGSGHDVNALTLTGLGDRSHLSNCDIDIETHIADVINSLKFSDLSGVSLVGWSYGGMVITAVADRVPERIDRVIYLDAPVPLDGQALYDTFPEGAELRRMQELRSEAAGTPGWIPFNPEGAEAKVPDGRDREWFLSKITPHPLATCSQPVRLGDSSLSGIVKIFIECREGTDPADPDPPFVARAKTESDWHYLTLDANHIAPVSAYQQLSDVLLECVR